MLAKAYIALITKWYVTEIFLTALSRQKPPKLERWRHSGNILPKNRMKLSANESLLCTDYKLVLYVTKFFRLLYPRQKPPKFAS